MTDIALLSGAFHLHANIVLVKETFMGKRKKKKTGQKACALISHSLPIVQMVQYSEKNISRKDKKVGRERERESQ